MTSVAENDNGDGTFKLLKALELKKEPTCKSPATLDVYPRGRSLSLNLKATVFKSWTEKQNWNDEGI